MSRKLRSVVMLAALAAFALFASSALAGGPVCPPPSCAPCGPIMVPPPVCMPTHCGPPPCPPMQPCGPPPCPPARYKPDCEPGPCAKVVKSAANLVVDVVALPFRLVGCLAKKACESRNVRRCGPPPCPPAGYYPPPMPVCPPPACPPRVTKCSTGQAPQYMMSPVPYGYGMPMPQHAAPVRHAPQRRMVPFAKKFPGHLLASQSEGVFGTYW